MDLLTLKTFDNPLEAHSLRNRLLAEDINAYIYDEHLIGLNPLFSNAIGGIKVKIAQEDFDQASRVLQAIDSLEYVEDREEILKCPNCDSTDINTDFRDFKHISGVLSLLFSIAFVVYPIYFKRKCKCYNCDLEFERDT